jgi:MFS family permease
MTFSKHVETVAIQVFLVKVYGKEGAPLALAAMALTLALPVMLLAIGGGQMADRFDRRRLLMATLTLGALASIGLLAVLLCEAPVAWIFVMLAVGAVGQALGSPARAAILPQLVPAEIFSNAVTWNTTVFYLATVSGPALGGLIVHLAGNSPAPAIAVVVGCRLFAIVVIALMRYRKTERYKQDVSWRSVMAGIGFVWRTKLILATITLDMFAVLLGGALYLLPIYAEFILHVGPWGLGLLRAADAVGAMCMAVYLAHRRPLQRPGVAMLWAIAGFGAAWMVFGVSKWFWLSLLMMLLVGALDNISVVVRHTLVQMLTPDEMRGRVSAVHGVFIVASNDLGGLESTMTTWGFGRLVGAELGPVCSVVFGGLGTILVVLASLGIWPQIRRIGPLDTIRPATIGEPDRET